MQSPKGLISMKGEDDNRGQLGHRRKIKKYRKHILTIEDHKNRERMEIK